MMAMSFFILQIQWRNRIYSAFLSKREILRKLFDRADPLSIPFLQHIFKRDKSKRCRIHTVSLPSCISRTIIEDMAEMGIWDRTTDLGTSREDRIIFMKYDISRINRLREARPSCPRVILITWRVEWHTAHDIDIDTCAVIVLILIREWSLCTSFLGDWELQRSKFRPQLIFGGKSHARKWFHFFFFGYVMIVCSPDFLLVFSATRSVRIELIVKRIHLVIILMIIFRGIERREWKYRSHELPWAESSWCLECRLRIFCERFLFIILIPYRTRILRSSVDILPSVINWIRCPPENLYEIWVINNIRIVNHLNWFSMTRLLTSDLFICRICFCPSCISTHRIDHSWIVLEWRLCTPETSCSEIRLPILCLTTRRSGIIRLRWLRDSSTDMRPLPPEKWSEEDDDEYYKSGFHTKKNKWWDEYTCERWRTNENL